MILLEKYLITNGKNELLNGWTETFDNVDDLIDFLKKHKEHLLSNNRLDSYKIVLRNIWFYQKGSDEE